MTIYCYHVTAKEDKDSLYALSPQVKEDFASANDMSMDHKWWKYSKRLIFYLIFFIPTWS